jgi:hypothetical protein
MLQHIQMTGTLNYKNAKQHFPFAFTMPEGATRLDIQFRYTPMQSAGQPVPNDLSLTVCDPVMVRGARHSNPDRDLFITPSQATPGYVPGPLQPGTWIIWIDAHRIMPLDIITFAFDIAISDAPAAEISPREWVKAPVAARGPGWFRGDLHGHTIHSDGAWDVPDFVQYGRDFKLDFVTLTDHNTISPLSQLDSLAGDDLLTMGGMELTSYFGHALALGTRTWQEWRVGLKGRSMPELAAQVMAAGAQYVIAHPMSVGDPYCTGCDWGYPDMMPGNARRVEVWNGPWAGDSNNESALRLWYSWLNQGYRMVATGGTDIHGPITDHTHGFNHVFADALTESAILEGISRGHSYISAGPWLTLEAQNEAGHRVMMGDLLPGTPAQLMVTWKDVTPGNTLRVIANGQVFTEMSVSDFGTQTFELSADSAKWYVVELRAKNGVLNAITNPIFIAESAVWR